MVPHCEWKRFSGEVLKSSAFYFIQAFQGRPLTVLKLQEL